MRSLSGGMSVYVFGVFVFIYWIVKEFFELGVCFLGERVLGEFWDFGYRCL